MINDLGAGDIVVVRFDTAFGHEQAGTRPALVMSIASYNAFSSFVLVCPFTTNAKPWPFKLALPASASVKGFVLADQLKSIDRRRIARRVAQLDAFFLSEVRALIDLVLVVPADRAGLGI